MRQNIRRSPIANRSRAGNLLFSLMCSLWQSDPEARPCGCDLPCLRRSVREIQSGNPKESHRQALLFFRVLVRTQSAREPLSVGWWPARADEPELSPMARSRAQSRCLLLPHLLVPARTRSASHLSVRNASRAALGRRQRHYALPFMSYKHQAPRNRARGHVPPPSRHAGRGVAC